MPSSRCLLFHRDYRGYTGGHGKVWHYFNHAIAAGWDARVYFTKDSTFNCGNPWVAARDRIVDEWRPELADALFIGGEDWNAVPDGLEQKVPTMNLIQGVRHADPELPLRSFLRRKAHRICVGQPVADAILATGEVNGPVTVIPAAIDLPSIRLETSARIGVLIDAIKRPALGRQLASVLAKSGQDVRLVERRIARCDYLSCVADAEMAVLLPFPSEGFYLPALEAMALGTPVVTLDAIGNRAYISPERNALVPSDDVDSLMLAVLRLQEDTALRCALVDAGLETADRFSLQAEKARFFGLACGMDRSDQAIHV